MDSSVQPSELWTDRTGRLALNSMISFMRTPKICEETPSALSDSRKTAMGAILAGVIFLERSSLAFCASVSAGMVPIMRVQAKGGVQLERTLTAAMSSAIDRDKPIMPILAAE